MTLSVASINCFMACTVLCTLPLVFYSPVSGPLTAVRLWNVTKNVMNSVYGLCPCGLLFGNHCGLTTW